MAWVLLLLAACCEMAWPLGFKYTKGFKEHYPVVALTMAMMILSFWLMSQAVGKGVAVGTAYAVWTGLGAAGTAILGIVIFKEPHQFMRVACIGFVVAGVVGLKLYAPPEAG
jgi:quaternary ammonium compound-resistance protein SugE